MVPLASVQKIAGHHGVEGRAGQGDAGRAEYDHVELEVLPNLFDRRIFEHRPQGFQRG